MTISGDMLTSNLLSSEKEIKRLYLSHTAIEPYMPNTDKIAKTIKDKITFVNAAFRPDKTDTINMTYSLVFFKYVAISDEKHEGILPVLINGLNLSTVHSIPDIGGIVERL